MKTKKGQEQLPAEEIEKFREVVQAFIAAAVQLKALADRAGRLSKMPRRSARKWPNLNRR